jgi:PKD repeat protein
LLCSGLDSLLNTELNDYNVVWQDGSTDPDYLITEGGEYYLSVTDSEGCTLDSDTVVVTEDFFPETMALAEQQTFCLGNELFLSSGFEEAETYTWSTGEDTPFIQPQESGTYWVEATNANGCVGRDTVEISLAGVAPTVEYSTGLLCEDNPVSFSDSTVPDDAEIADWTWNIQSENESESEVLVGEDVIYNAEDDGELYVSLTVTLDNGCTGTIRDTVVVNPLPVVDFNFDEVIVCAGNEAAFESESFVPGNGFIDSYSWIFGNGTTDAGIVGSTTFEEQGPADIRHIVVSQDGCVDSLDATVVVLGSPIADFSVEDVCLGTPAVFEEEVDISESGPVFYNWQFGDGFFSNFPNTSHVYSAPGVYNVQLTATGNNFGVNGCTDAAVRQIRVYEVPEASIELEDVCLGEEMSLTDLTQASSEGGLDDPIVSRTWSWITGPGFSEEISADSAGVWLPPSDGLFTIEFDFSTASGCSGSAAAQATVLEIPAAEFSLDVPNGAPPLSATPINTSEDAEGFEWFVNGSFLSNAAEPEIGFPESGTYLVELVATNSLNCNDTTSQTFVVIDPEYDIAILDISYQELAGRLELTALLSNNGNAPITSFDMNIVIGREIDVNQSIEHVILPGDLVSYDLPTDFVYDAGRVLPFTCIEVSNPNDVGEDELNLENNKMCIGLDKERPTFIAPYPNPAGDLVNLGFILPQAGTVEVEIVGSDGKIIEAFDLVLEEGYSVFEYPVNGYSEGLYFVRYEFEGESGVERLVVAR